MHDDRGWSRSGSTGCCGERIRPATYAATVPLELAVWHVPGEPVPVGRGAGRRLRAVHRRARRGAAPWSTTLVPGHRRGARRVGRPPGRGGVRPRVRRRLAGLPGRGARPRPGRRARSRASRRGTSTCRSPTRPPAASRSGCWSRRPPTPTSSADGFLPTPLGDRLTAGDEPLYPFARADLAVLDEDVWHLGLDVEVLSRADARAGRHRPAPARDPPRRWSARSTRSTSTDVAGTAGAAARAALVDVLARPAHASAHTISRGRPRAHRQRLAVAAARDACASPRARSPTSPRWPPTTPSSSSRARRPSSTPGSRSTSPEVFRRIAGGREGRPVAAGRRHVGRGRRQPARRRGAGPPARARQAVLPRRVRRRVPGRVAARLVRLHRGVPAARPAGRDASGSSPRRSPGTRPTSSRTTRSGGRASTAPGSSPTSRRPTPTTARFDGRGAGARRAQLRRQGRRHPVAAAVRARRRRRRPHPRDAGAGPAAARPGGLAAGGDRAPRTPSSPPRATEYPDAPVWSGELYLELHRATYTSQARTKAGNRRSEHLLREAELWAATRRGAAPGSRLPVRRAGPAVEDRAAAPVPRHPAGQLDRLGAPRGRGDLRRGGGRAGGDHRSRAARRAGRRRRPRVGVQRRPAGPRRGRAVPGGHHRRQRSRWLGRASRRGRARRRRRRPPPDAGAPSATPWLDNGLVRVELDADGLLTSVATWPPAARCSPPARAATCCSCTPTCPNHWDAWDVDRHYRRQRHRPDRRRRRHPRRARPAGRRDPRRAVVRGVAAHPDRSRLTAGSRADRRRHRGRLARAGEVPQGRVPARRARRPVRGRDPVRPRAPADPHQHQLGRRPVRDLLPTAGSTSPSPATASRCSTTRPTATTSAGRPATTAAPRRPCG